MNVATGIRPLIGIDPLGWLGEQAKETLADGFTSMMMSVWSGAMWLMKVVFGFMDEFTPNVQDPDLKSLYEVTLWASFAIALLIAFGQIGLAVARQDGKGFATLAAGLVQYGLVVVCWVGVGAGLITAASGLTKGLLNSLLGVNSFSGYAATDGFVDTVSGTVQATVLGVSALFVLLPASFGHLLIMLVRSAALLILTASFPIAAAGALSEGTKSWMWKSVRWFCAALLIEPLLALVLGLGTQFAWAGMPDGDAATGSSSAENIIISVVGSVLLLVACFTPLALFRLLAFVDPGTASGASFRSTMAANGGAAGLLRPRNETSNSGAATESAPDGRTAAENGADAQTANRFQEKVATRLGKVGNVVAAGMEKSGQIAQAGTALSVDVLGQSGVGNQGYYDTSYSPGARRQPQRPARGGQGGSTREDIEGVANDIKPVAEEAVDEGAFLA